MVAMSDWGGGCAPAGAIGPPCDEAELEALRQRVLVLLARNFGEREPASRNGAGTGTPRMVATR